MATGIPQRSSFRQLASTSYRIEYEGKHAENAVLSGSRAVLKRVITIPGSPVNMILYGDNLPLLLSLCDDINVWGKVRLIYIDPPYATGSQFESRQQDHAYHDVLEGAAYLEFLRQRLVVLRELLADDGSIYVHLDDNMAFPVKVVMDEIFGSRNFRNWITRKKSNPKNYTRKQYGNIADYILFYSKSDQYIWNQPFDGWTDATAAKEYTYIEEGTGRRYKKVPVHAPGVRNGETGQPWRGKLPPPGKHWQYTPATLDEMDARGEIYWSPTGNPRRKIYLDDSKGIPSQDIWLDFKDAHNQNIHITGYPTEKNPELLRRIIRASSHPGDIVLDAFAGSGTTPVVAEEEGRRWIAIDSSPLALATMVQRLAVGTEPMGDFVGARGKQAQTLPLFKRNRILMSGLDVFIDDYQQVEPLSASDIQKWRVLLSEG